MGDIELTDESGTLVFSEAEVRALRDQHLTACGFASFDEYRAYMVGKCHHKCWRPEGVSSWSWYSIEQWDGLLSHA